MKQTIRLLNGDCKELFSKLYDCSVDLIITDPPYGVGYSKGFNDSIEYVRQNIRIWLTEMYRILKEGCHCYIFVPTKQIGLWTSLVEEIFTFNNILTVKALTGVSFLKNNFQYNSQLIIYCSKGTAKNFNKYDYFKSSKNKENHNKNLQTFSYAYPSLITECYANASLAKDILGNRHPCAKNPELIKVLIGISSNPNDIVFDPFMGVGTTGVSTIRNGRKFVGSELNYKYITAADDRIASYL